MTNEEYYKTPEGKADGFRTFCASLFDPDSQDCTGCPVYGMARGMNSCFNAWLKLQAGAVADGVVVNTPAPGMIPWGFNEAAALIGKSIAYNHPNHCRALYQVLGVYQAQNGKVMVMVANDCLSTDTLLDNARYSFEGRRCGEEVF